MNVGVNENVQFLFTSQRTFLHILFIVSVWCSERISGQARHDPRPLVFPFTYLQCRILKDEYLA